MHLHCIIIMNAFYYALFIINYVSRENTSLGCIPQAASPTIVRAHRIEPCRTRVPRCLARNADRGRGGRAPPAPSTRCCQSTSRRRRAHRSRSPREVVDLNVVASSIGGIPPPSGAPWIQTRRHRLPVVDVLPPPWVATPRRRPSRAAPAVIVLVARHPPRYHPCRRVPRRRRRGYPP